MFVDDSIIAPSGGGDYHLDEDSACIDAGNPDEFDYEGASGTDFTVPARRKLPPNQQVCNYE